MHDTVRQAFDTLWATFYAKQGMFAKKAMAAKKDELWVEFEKVVRPLVAKRV